MHHIFKRTVVLLNDFESIDNLLQKAINFSTKHHSTLEILYVQEETLFDIPDYFLSEDKIANERLDKKKIQDKIKEHLLALNVTDKHAILVYENDTVDQVIHYAKEQKDILFITAYHQGLSEKLIEKAPYSFWVIKNNNDSYKNIALPLDFSEKSKKSLQISQHIFDKNTITIIHDYRYMLDTLTIQVDYLDVVPIITPDVLQINETLKKEQKKQFEHYIKEFNVKGVCIEGESSLDQDLVKYISKKDFDLTIMYHQDAELFLSPSLIVELLKKLSTDFFVFNL